MSKLVFVGDENHSIVDEWMAESKDSVQHTNLTSLKSGDVKSGLGYVEDSKKNVKVVDKFAQAMEKKNKNKNKRSREGNNDDEDNEPTHGLVEDMEESRTAIGAFVKKSVMKAQKKQKALEDAKAAESQKVAVSAPAVEPTPVAQQSSPSDPSSESVKPKRVKTRSKQKNIRRDNRSAESKPSHLQIGSKEYSGRPLTQETKKLLGIAKPPNAGDNNRNKNNKGGNFNRHGGGHQNNKPNKGSGGMLPPGKALMM